MRQEKQIRMFIKYLPPGFPNVQRLAVARAAADE